MLFKMTDRAFGYDRKGYVIFSVGFGRMEDKLCAAS